MNKRFNFDTNKVSIVGCGNVGMTTAYSLIMTGLVHEIVLLGRCVDKLIGEQLDLEHALPFLNYASILATEDYENIKDSDIVVVTAGAHQAPGETRLDLAKKNIRMVEEMIPKIVEKAPNSIIIMVSNPVDILTYKAYQLAGFPKGRVFGTGTALDTARFQFYLSEIFKVDPKSIHAYILGEHGDSSFPAISGATIGSQLINSFPGYSEHKVIEAYHSARNAAYKIIQSKGATYYAIGTVLSHIIEAVLRDSREILPLSIPLHKYHGHSGIALSAPCIIGRNGVEQTIEVPLSSDEMEDLNNSVEILKGYL